MSTAKDLISFLGTVPADTMIFYSTEMGCHPSTVQSELTYDHFEHYQQAFIYHHTYNGVFWSKEELKDLPAGTKFIGRRDVLHFDV